ncbi:MAG: adenosylcobinamide-phosphate synthase CbiB [Paramuribaculum sp.]|nr:adenosylcobinamide-phosphate synthase CbiB [Paramuribaculum sp.]
MTHLLLPDILLPVLPLLLGWIADLLIGDPERWTHPVIWMGKAISSCEHSFNHGAHRFRNGAFTAIGLITSTFILTEILLYYLSPYRIAYLSVIAIGVFFCLAGCTLRREVRMVFQAADHSLDEGRRQVGRIVGRDTQSLTDQEVRTAALETLAENLSDGVVAPLFWFALLGLPGMMAYKMVNTLDSMIGYRTERYRQFGCVAARIDDIANYIPARLTAFLLLLAAGRLDLFGFVGRYGPAHASPNSGWPEAALAGILNCRFGGTHDYFGESVYKPYIGETERILTSADVHRSLAVAMRAEGIMVAVTAVFIIFLHIL